MILLVGFTAAGALAATAADRSDSPVGHAQERGSVIAGTVTDASGAVLVGATVTVRHTLTGAVRETATDANGRYRFASLPAGSYNVTIALAGFAGFERAAVDVVDGATQNVDAALAVGGLQENIAVAAAVLSGPADVTRLPVPLDRVPQAVSVVSRDVLVEQRSVTLVDALRNVSGVSTRGTDAGTNEDFTIRGFQTNSRSNYFRDGVRFFNGFAAEVPSLDRIEVLKGPASILFGSVEPGGVINLVTRPLSANARREVAVDVASYGDRRVRFDFSGPVARQWQYRAYGSFRDAGSFRDVVDNRRSYFEAALGWTPTGSTSVTVTANYLNDQQTPDTGIPAILDGPADVHPSNYYGEPYNFDRQRTASGTLKLVHAFSPRIRVTSSVSYYDVHRDRYEATPQNPNVGLPGQDAYPGLPRRINRSLFINDYTQDEIATQHDAVVRADHGPLTHTVLFGFDARRFGGIEDADDGLPFRAAYFINLDAPDYAAGPPAVPGFPVFFRYTDQRETAAGAYVQDSVAIGSRWVALAGVRWDHNVLRQDQRTTTAASFERQSTAATPRAGLVFKPIEPLSLYASYSRSFSPRIGTIFPNTPVEPERAEQVEGGLKLAMTSRAAATIAVYELTRQDVVVGDPQRTSFSLQVGEQRSRGVDVDLAVRPDPRLSLVGSYAFTDAVIVRDTRLPVGNRLDNAPRHSGSIWGSYHFDDTLRGLSAGLGLFLVGERQGNLENNFRLPRYTRTDAMVSYAWRPATIAINVTNLTDQRYYLNSWRRDRIMPGAPRQIALTVKYAF